CSSIAAVCGDADADGYRRFVEEWTPRTRAFLAAGAAAPTAGRLARAGFSLTRTRGRPRQPRAAVIRAALAPAEVAIGEAVGDQRLRAALGWWAAQSGPPPHGFATAPLAGTVAMLHMRRAARP